METRITVMQLKIERLERNKMSYRERLKVVENLMGDRMAAAVLAAGTTVQWLKDHPGFATNIVLRHTCKMYQVLQKNLTI